MLRAKPHTQAKLSDIKLHLSDLEVTSFRLHANSPLIGKMLSEAIFRSHYGLNVLLIRRRLTILSNPAPDIELIANDVIVVVGARIPSARAEKLFGQANPLYD